MKKLWSVTVNNPEWNYPRICFFDNREQATAFANQFQVHSSTKYRGVFTDKNAAMLMDSWKK